MIVILSEIQVMIKHLEIQTLRSRRFSMVYFLTGCYSYEKNADGFTASLLRATRSGSRVVAPVNVPESFSTLRSSLNAKWHVSMHQDDD